MFVITDAADWAQENFGECELGDKRRGARLVRMARDLARHAGSSLLKSCDGDEAAAEGMYRVLRNAEIEPASIAEGGCQATLRRARSCAVLLAVEDSTSFAPGAVLISDGGRLPPLGPEDRTASRPMLGAFAPYVL